VKGKSKSLAFNMSKPGFIFILLALGIFMFTCTNAMQTRSSSQERFYVEEGESFELKKGQIAGLKGTGFELQILRFFNQPCPPNVKCVWSGIGIEFEYRNNGQSVRGINLVKAFGYKTTIVRSDYESFAVVKITQDLD
jgi:hypothetical protein